MRGETVSISEDDRLMLSGLQHFAFCRRQWALIHIENLWKDNLLTVEGDLMHNRAHDEKQRELRGNILTLRNLPVFSDTLGVSGRCDVVEFHRDPKGVTIRGEKGLWRPYPIEYKHGAPKTHNADKLQLCGQVMCLEEMLCCEVPEGALYYGKIGRRTVVSFTEELRGQVRDFLNEMRMLYERGYTPKVRPSKSCNACSLKELCLPALMRGKNVLGYLRQAVEETK